MSEEAVDVEWACLDVNAPHIDRASSLSSSTTSSSSSSELPLVSSSSLSLPSVWRPFFLPLGTLRRGSYEVVDVSYGSLDYQHSDCALKRDFDLNHDVHSLFYVGLKWAIITIIGVLTGTVSFYVWMAIRFVADHKYSFILNLLEESNGDLTKLTYAIIAGLVINALLCLVASVLGVLSPASTGSGIPHIKNYLNGVSIPRLMRIKTLLCKVVGVVCSVGGGLPVGKEGPMIHSGAIIAAGFSQGKSTSMMFNTKLMQAFRTDAHKRDFVACGSAAGVAAAFGAPFGGVLFAIEEAVSNFEYNMLLMILFASLVSYFTLNCLKSLVIPTDGSLSSGGLISFGQFNDPGYTPAQLLAFLPMAVVGGLMGALHNALNARITQFRLRYLQSPLSRVAEVVSWSMVVTMSAFLSMSLIRDCKPINNEYNEHLVQLNCKDGEYHAFAAIWFATPENIVKDLFHNPNNTYDVTSLLLFTIVYFNLAMYTYGLCISSGIFIPSLLTGAAWGRMYGILLKTHLNTVEWGDIGNFALIGAASQLSGNVRMTVSVCAILTEATGSLVFVAPILFVVIIAKFTGDFFNEGIYDIHSNLAGVPFLDWNPPAQLSLAVKDIMATPVKCLHMRMRTKELVDLLRSTTHAAFPIVDATDPDSSPSTTTRCRFGRLRGIVLRTDITTMLLNAFWDDDPTVVPTWEDFIAPYPRFWHIDDIFLTEHTQMTTYLDFRKIMNPSVVTISPQTSFDNCFRMFRRVGLRHLVVIDDHNEVIGIVTRKDLFRPVHHKGHVKLRTQVLPSQ